ncbi:ABC transporter substrate-binding protein [Alkalihalobacillus sp. 1P02AB]|uniref:ABC transporter substrate-binding protein n=1 Tax=Alkalihalobacillus sp. 1P02AB TaxID=3132260 RepID=UPI0039A76D63
MKKLLIVLLMATMVMVGCNSTASSDEVSIEFYFPVAVGGPIANIIDEYVEEFEAENENIKVTSIFGGSYQDTMTQVLAAVQAGNSPDLAVLLSVELFTLLEMGAIEEVTPYFSEDYLDDFYEGFIANSAIDDEIWSVPFQRSTIVLYYNKDMFEAAGLDPEQPPTTWEELVEYSEKLTVRDGSGNVTQWGVQLPSTGFQYWITQALALQTGENIMSEDGTEVYFDSPEVEEALQFWVDLGNEHEVMPKGIIDWGTVPSNFLSGQTAMMYHTTGNLTNVRESAEFDFGVALLPANNQFGSPTGGGNLYLFNDIPEENKEAAIKFIEFLTSPEKVAEWSMDTGYVATRESAYETEELVQYIEEFPAAKVARDQLDYSASELATYQNGEVQQIFNDAIQSILTGERSVKEGLERAQNSANNVLQRFQD